ncbi:MAG TPA: hypothetical protein P5348_04300, partial [Bacteroidales bacterium]|nr:hypothetical protein [Bacteroidales bacterium]
MKTLTGSTLIAAAAVALLLSSCEGPMGMAGKDANESCTKCHNPEVTGAKSIEYAHSVHYEGEAFEEGTRTNCAPCHSHQGFLYVVKNNTPVTFVQNGSSYTNSCVVNAATASLPGPISCFTCHSSLHSTYTDE